MTTRAKQQSEKSASSELVLGLKRVHVLIALVGALVFTGIGIGRFESRSAAQEKRIETTERTMDEKMEELRGEVLRHLDIIEQGQHEVVVRIDAHSETLRTISEDVAVLCAKTPGKPCSRR